MSALSSSARIGSHGFALSGIPTAGPYCGRFSGGPRCRQRHFLRHHRRHAADSVGVLIGEKMPVSVHRQRDARMTHDGLDDVRLDALQCQPRARGVTQGVKVEFFPFVVRDGQEIAFLSFDAGLGFSVRPAGQAFGSYADARQKIIDTSIC